MKPETHASSNPDPSLRRHGRSTLQDVAKACGVTQITVSRYLREPAKVAPATAARIAAALSELAYMPNKQAGMLASGRSRMVAAIVPSLANSVFAETVQGLSEGLQAEGFELLLASSGYSLQREEEQLRAVLGWRPDALAVTGRQHTEGALALMRAAKGNGTPVIEMWDRQPEAGAQPAREGLTAARRRRAVDALAPEFTQVGFDHAAVGAAMAEHLQRGGRQRLAYVDTGVAADFRAHERGQAFLAAAPGALLITAPAGDALDAGRAALRELLDGRGRLRVDAAAFANDNLACGAWFEAAARGVAVPSQLALLGFGDFALSRQLGGGISTVHPPRYDIGRETARVMLRQLGTAPSAAPEPTPAVPWQLIARASTGAA